MDCIAPPLVFFLPAFVTIRAQTLSSCNFRLEESNKELLYEQCFIAIALGNLKNYYFRIKCTNA